MASTYSIVMAELQGFTGTFHLAPPPGFVWVLRTIDINFTQALPGSIAIYGSADQTVFQASGDEALTEYSSWRGRHVIANPDTWRVVGSGAGGDVTISGYQLSGF